MILQQSQGLAWYTFAAISTDEVVHGAFTRQGGVSRAPFGPLNVGAHVGDDPQAVAENHRALFRVLGWDEAAVVSAGQVHGDTVAVVDESHGGQTLPETDALITQARGVLLLLRFADCVPVLLVDPVRHAVGLAHAGWKGTVLEIAVKTVDAMHDAFGSQPAELIAGLGPAIGPCCFEVGDDVVAPLRQRYGSQAEALIHQQADGAEHVDLWLANRWQLQSCGVTQIETSQICTCCHQDEFPSHRGEKGVTGRFPAVIGLCKR